MTGAEARVDDAERHARMLMSRVCEPGDADACRLVHEHGAVALLDRIAARDHRAGKLEAWAARLGATSLDKLRAQADEVDARYACPGDDEWAPELDDLARLDGRGRERRAGAPFGLWLRGTGRLSATARSLSIVGSRASSAYGDQVAGDLAFHCGSRGFVVVSGGAYGIDAAAHRGALAGGFATVAVLAGGIDRLYPAGNKHLLRAVIESGLLVAEAAPGCTPNKSRFLTRNRVIAALGSGTLVVEAALRSGALSSARWALDLGRPVMGVPGPVTSMASAGVHELLRQPEPLLVTDADEVIEHISAVGTNLAARKQGDPRPRDEMSPQMRRILDAVPRSWSASVSSISVAAGVSVHETSAMLARLVSCELVERDAEGWRLAVWGDSDAVPAR